MPHDPLQVDAKYEEHESCKNKANWRRKRYCGMVIAVDESIGIIKNQLSKYNLLDDSIIVFFSDNGGTPILGGFNYSIFFFKTEGNECKMSIKLAHFRLRYQDWF